MHDSTCLHGRKDIGTNCGEVRKIGGDITVLEYKGNSDLVRTMQSFQEFEFDDERQYTDYGNAFT